MPTESAFLAVAEEMDEMAGHVWASVARVTARSEGIVIGGSLYDRVQRMLDDAVAHRDAISTALTAAADLARQRAAVCRRYTQDMAEYREHAGQWLDAERDPFLARPSRPATWCDEG